MYKMNNLVPIPFVIFGILVLVTVIAIMRGEGKVRAGSSKSLSGSLSKILMGSSKKSSKKSSGGKKYMGFTMTQLLVGGAVIAGLYYYQKEGFSNPIIDQHFLDSCKSFFDPREDEPGPLDKMMEVCAALDGEVSKFKSTCKSVQAEPPAEPVDMGVVSLPKALAAWRDIGAKIVGGG